MPQLTRIGPQERIEITTVGVLADEITNRDAYRTRSPWWETTRITVPHLMLARQAARKTDADICRWLAENIESDWLRTHRNYLVRVSWPDRVTEPAYNAEATYAYPYSMEDVARDCERLFEHLWDDSCPEWIHFALRAWGGNLWCVNRLHSAVRASTVTIAPLEALAYVAKRVAELRKQEE